MEKGSKKGKVEDSATREPQKEWAKEGNNNRNSNKVRAKGGSKGTQGMGKEKARHPSMGSVTTAMGRQDGISQEIVRGPSRRTH